MSNDDYSNLCQFNIADRKVNPYSSDEISISLTDCIELKKGMVNLPKVACSRLLSLAPGVVYW